MIDVAKPVCGNQAGSCGDAGSPEVHRACRASAMLSQVAVAGRPLLTLPTDTRLLDFYVNVPDYKH